MRDKFEDWFGKPARGLDRNGDIYKLASAHQAWLAWQAALASQAAPDSGALTMAGAAKGRQGEADPNAPWLSEAHALCSDAGIPPGHISDRIRALRDKQTAQAEPVAWRAYGAGHWNDGLPSQSSIEYYGANLQYAYAAPPAPSVPAQGATATGPRFTYGHCADRRQVGGCTRHNLYCGYPDCDRKEVPRG